MGNLAIRRPRSPRSSRIGNSQEPSQFQTRKERFTMTAEQNKAIVRRFFEAFEANDQAAMKEVLAPDLVAYTHGDSAPTSRDAMLQAISYWNASIESHYTIEEQIAEG